LLDLATRARAILAAADPAEKVALTRALAADWRAGTVPPPEAIDVPDRPARLPHPVLVHPRDVPKRKIGAGVQGRVALLHALAHIELNAIDLAWDMLARFAHAMPRGFARDWLHVAADEAEHFALLSARLTQFGAAYGDLPAHDGLWQAAAKTAHDLLARLAVVPMVLEARGLDVTPAMIEKLDTIGDAESAAILRRIYADEVGHVAAGVRWFEERCAAQGLDTHATWRDLTKLYCDGAVRPPFNDDARGRAGMAPALYAETG
jgi:uncharacterized ferritin-like protein (DUF455 family)